MRHRQKLPETSDILIRTLYYSIRGENEKAISLSEMQHALKPKDALLLSDLIVAYARNFMIDKYQKASQQLTELVPDDPYNLWDLANGYLLTGEFDKGLKILAKSLKLSSEDIDALFLMGDIYLHKNDPDAAEKIYQKAILVQPENEKSWSKMFNHIAYSRNNKVTDEFLKQFIGDYRFETGEMTLTIFTHNNYLIIKAKNQFPGFGYPVSDSMIISINGTAAFKFVRDNLDNISKAVLYQNNLSRIVWKEDSLILKATILLNEKNNAKALPAFREAYVRHPDHYYLSDYIRHLEFIQSEVYERNKAVLESCVGKYGDMTIFKKNDLFYYEDQQGCIYRLLPLSEDQFISPSFYNRHFDIIRKNNLIAGLKVIYMGGKELFFPREI
jgi:tetratricopeptide (TPR) repeat protein